MTYCPDIENLPGWELILPGLEAAAAGCVTPEACLVWIAAPRLRAAGLLSGDAEPMDEPERMLYDLLRKRGGDAYPAYQSLLRRLVSFERALRP